MGEGAIGLKRFFCFYFTVIVVVIGAATKQLHTLGAINVGRKQFTSVDVFFLAVQLIFFTVNQPRIVGPVELTDKFESVKTKSDDWLHAVTFYHHQSIIVFFRHDCR